MYHKILVATDGSEHAQRAVLRAGELALCAPAEVMVITILHLPASYLLALGSGIGMGSEPWAALRRSCEQVLEEALTLLSSLGIQAKTELKMGEPGEEVLRLAREGGFDLIVAGRRGRGRTRSHLLGSVSSRISFGSPCDILIVR